MVHLRVAVQECNACANNGYFGFRISDFGFFFQPRIDLGAA